MKKIFIFSLILIIPVVGFLLLLFSKSPRPDENINKAEKTILADLAQVNQSEIIAQRLTVPWEMAYLPDGSILVTERAGTLLKLGPDGFARQVPGVEQMGEGGLLGMALHPDFNSNHWIYLYHTTKINGGVKNIVERYTLAGNELSERVIIIDNIPAAQIHDGGRLAFGPDGFLYATTGSASNDGAQVALGPELMTGVFMSSRLSLP